MPRFKGACGCYNKEDATKFGLATAVIWFDILNHSEIHNINPVWYDQRRASERTGIPYRTIGDAINKLAEAGRLRKKVGYRPGTTVKTTWIEILVEDLDKTSASTAHQKGGSRTSKKGGDRTSILKDTNNKNTIKDGEVFSFDVREGGPAEAGGTVGALDTFIKEVLETAGFNPTISRIREATPAAKKALKEKITKEEILEAAKGVRAVKEGKAGEGLTPSIRSPFQRPDFWAEKKPTEKPKGVW